MNFSQTFMKLDEKQQASKRFIQRRNITKDFMSMLKQSEIMNDKIVFTPNLLAKMTIGLKNSQLVKDKVEKARIALANNKGMQEIIRKRQEGTTK
jgi:hypothetical protein